MADASRKTHFMIELIKRWVRGFKGIDWALVCPVPTPRPSPLSLSFILSCARGAARASRVSCLSATVTSCQRRRGLPSPLAFSQQGRRRRAAGQRPTLCVHCAHVPRSALFETLSSRRTAKRRSDPGVIEGEGVFALISGYTLLPLFPLTPLPLPC